MSENETIIALLNRMSAQMEAMDAKLTSMDARLTAMEARLTAIEESQAAMELRLTAIEESQAVMEKRQAAMDARLTAIEARQEVIEESQTAIEKQLSSMEKGQGAILRAQISLEKDLATYRKTANERLLALEDQSISADERLIFTENNATILADKSMDANRAIVAMGESLANMNARLTTFEATIEKGMLALGSAQATMSNELTTIRFTIARIETEHMAKISAALDGFALGQESIQSVKEDITHLEFVTDNHDLRIFALESTVEKLD